VNRGESGRIRHAKVCLFFLASAPRIQRVISRKSDSITSINPGQEIAVRLRRRVVMVTGPGADPRFTAATSQLCCSAQSYLDNSDCDILLTRAYCETHAGRLASSVVIGD